MPTYTVSAIVLRRINLGETDKILTLFTREAGKLTAIAKGARRATSRLSGATELFTASKMLLATGRSLEVVTQCEVKDSFPSLREDVYSLARAAYLCELLDHFTAERDDSASEDIFTLILWALRMLKRLRESQDIAVHAFELRLLATLGYLPVLDQCVRCERPLGRVGLGFSPALGGVLCAEDRSRADDQMAISIEAIEAMRGMAAGSNELLQEMQVSERAASHIDRAMRWYVRYRSERGLRSAEFLDKLRAAS